MTTLTPARKRILEFLEREGPSTTGRIGYGLNYLSRPFGVLQKLREADLVKQSKDDGWSDRVHWEITDKGREALSQQ